MQNRMKNFALDREAIDALLGRAAVGRFSTNSLDGYPYTVPVHFIYAGGKIYFHGLAAGDKVDNVRRDPRVCFEVDEMKGHIIEGVESPCSAETEYESVVVLGKASLLEDPAIKEKILKAIVAKYVPSLSDRPMKPAMIAATGIVEITPERVTGKYHK